MTEDYADITGKRAGVALRGVLVDDELELRHIQVAADGGPFVFADVGGGDGVRGDREGRHVGDEQMRRGEIGPAKEQLGLYSRYLNQMVDAAIHRVAAVRTPKENRHNGSRSSVGGDTRG